MKNKTKGKQQKGEIRIIGGQWRGRRLSFIAQEGLRPTLNRFRETLFNWLMFDTSGARCLDLFAGSGALGLEALSRGASHVDFIDTSQLACQTIKDHLKQLDCRQAAVHQSSAEAWLKQHNSTHSPPKPYQLVFLDPPFHQELLQPCLYLLEYTQLLDENCCIYLEAEEQFNRTTLPSNWPVIKEKATGGKIFLLLKYQKTSIEPMNSIT